MFGTGSSSIDAQIEARVALLMWKTILHTRAA
jgi:hypothetical protein